MLTIALAGDTMLGRLVADLLDERPDAPLCDASIHAAAAAADLFLLNLECCLSARGEPWPDPAKPFFFRGPPRAATAVLSGLGVDVVTLANNHALDFGAVALADTLTHLDEAGIRHVGAGHDRAGARQPAVLAVDGTRVAVVGATDHPRDFAAGPDRPGVALWDLDPGGWPVRAIRDLPADVDVSIATVHWGPNMVTEPSPRIRAAAQALVDAGSTLVAGHSAHVFHGVQWSRRGDDHVPVLFDLGDFIDDYAVHPRLRNDLSALWLVHVEAGSVTAVEALPLLNEFRHTRPATGADRDWIVDRLADASATFGTTVVDDGDRLRLVPG